MMKFAYKIRLTIAAIVGILSILAVCGLFYPIKIMDIQFTPLLQRVISDFSILALVLLVDILLLTLVFGRFYCSTICPFGILQEFIALLRGKKKNTVQGNYGFKYLIAGLTIGALFGGSAIIIRYIDPYTIFGSAVSISLFGIIAVLVILPLIFFKNRFFCTNICPVGCILGLVSKLAVNKIYIDDNCVTCGMCTKNCPSGCINHEERIVNNETCVKCLRCLSVCPKKAIHYGIKSVKFSPKRRDLLWSLGALAILGAGYTAGVRFTKNIAKTIKNIILPAGAQNANRMANKCLNCNLCIKNCPNGILVKADEKFSAVHIDYSKGKGFCSFDCHKCAEVCPSGAIEKMSLDDKRSTRIAMAVVNSEDCVKCKRCVEVCPRWAITIKENQAAKIDASLCIGCGKCAVVCKPKAINIFKVNEQSQV